MKFEYDVITREFTIDELLLQDDFDDTNLYDVPKQTTVSQNSANRKTPSSVSYKFRPNLNIEDIAKYYPYFLTNRSTNNTEDPKLERKQK